MTYVIAQPCVDLKDKACIEECPVDCIYEGERSLYIHPDECVDCGACEPVCPVEAIYYEDDVPEQWKPTTTRPTSSSSTTSARPGGAAKLGVIPKDHPLIAALPPQEHDELTARRRPAAAGTARPGLPDFPWDPLAPYAATARRAPRRASSTCRSARRSTRRPSVVQRRAAPRPPTPPATRRPYGTAGAARGRRRLVRPPARRARRSTRDGVLPTIGSKELVAWLPTLLGPRARATSSCIPAVAYPTYDVGARLAGATPRRRRRPRRARPADRRGAEAGLAQLPGNPTGRVLGVDAPAQGRRLGARARRRRRQRRVLRRARLAAWDGRPASPSILDPRVCGGSPRGPARRLLAVQAVQPRRLPGGVRRRRPGAGRRGCSRCASTPG